MDSATTAPGGESLAPAATPAAPTPPGAPLSARAAAQHLARVRLARREPETNPPAPEAASAAPPAPGDSESPSQDGDAADPHSAAAPGAPAGGPDPASSDPEELPPIAPPQAWTTEEKERFKSLPRDLQAYLSEREQERDRDLRRRQNEAAEARKAVQAERAAAAKARADYEAALPALLQTLQAQQAGEFADIRDMADVQRLAAEDPNRYLRWDARQKQIAAVALEARAAQERQREETSALWGQFARAQDALFAERVPDILDDAKGARLREAAVNALRDTGFSEQELAAAWSGERGVSLRDHRVQLLIHDAVKYREAKAAAARPARPVPPVPVQRPGAAAPRAGAGDATLQTLSSRLDQSGSAKDAARLVAARRAARQR